MALATAPLSWFGLAWLALAPLWFLGRTIPQWRLRLLYGFLWGVGYYGGALFWITGIHPMTWMGVPWLASLAIALVCWVLITLWGAAIALVWALVWPILAPPSLLGRWLVGITFWCALESLWQLGPLWWPSLAYTQSPENLWVLHWGRLSGPTVVTALLVGVNGLLAEALLTLRPIEVSQPFTQTQKDSGLLTPESQLRPQKPLCRDGFETRPDRVLKRLSITLMSLRPTPPFWRLLLGTSSLLGLALGGGYALSQFSAEASNPPRFRVGIIQGNIPNEIKLYPAGWRQAIADYTQGYNTLAEQGVAAIVTPETSLPFVWSALVAQDHSFYRAVQRQQVPVWVGAFGQQGETFTNSLFSITAAGETLSQYDKVKLVPLGEYIPFANLLGRVIRRLSPLEAQLTAGTAEQTFETSMGPAIVGICYESAFPEHFRRQAARGGEFIVTVSNDAHYSVVMPAQHHALDVMRAIESDR